MIEDKNFSQKKRLMNFILILRDIKHFECYIFSTSNTLYMQSETRNNLDNGRQYT
jgi:hypothetical protein